jgi:TRAP-type transport system periplasmic protein
MAHGLSRRRFGTLAVAGSTFGILRHARGEDALKIRCSLDTGPSHIRNVSVVDYLKQLEQATGGKLIGEVFHAGQLYADLNVGKALLQGQVDMAVPGAWTQTGIVADCDFVQLPAFYGRAIEATHKATDGKAGQHVTTQLETKLRSKCLGPWFDLGYQNWYSTKKPIKGPDDIKGMKIRSPGGAGISWRIGFFGALANTTAWPNVPLALSQGTFDGFVSTDESCASAKLWEAGVRYSYADHQYVGQYVPLVSNAFWSKLSPDLQKTMVDLWMKNIPAYRENAMAAQMRARKLMQENGVTFFDPPAEQLAASRKAMEADVGTLIKDAKLSPEVVKLSNEAFA